MFENIPAELRNAGAGASGSLVALLFMRRPPLQMVGIFLGGVVLAYYGGNLLVIWFNLAKFEGPLGFVVGLLGMRLVEKFYEMVEAIDVKDFWQRILSRFGLGGS